MGLPGGGACRVGCVDWPPLGLAAPTLSELTLALVSIPDNLIIL